MTINTCILASLIEQMKGSVKAETEDEKKCFQLLSDLDHVNYKVQGSVTSKKYMYNKIWSLVSYLGASP